MASLLLSGPETLAQCHAPLHVRQIVWITLTNAVLKIRHIERLSTFRRRDGLLKKVVFERSIIILHLFKLFIEPFALLLIHRFVLSLKVKLLICISQLFLEFCDRFISLCYFGRGIFESHGLHLMLMTWRLHLLNLRFLVTHKLLQYLDFFNIVLLFFFAGEDLQLKLSFQVAFASFVEINFGEVYATYLTDVVLFQFLEEKNEDVTLIGGLEGHVHLHVIALRL